MTKDGLVIARRYKLLDVLGQGTFGQVFRARDTWLEEDVALKLSKRPSSDRLLSLWREASILRRLRLPGVARLLDEGQDRGLDFLVMELAHGQPLQALMGHDWETLRPVLVSLLTILCRVHDVGVIHGDLKPSNILVDELRRCTVLDFGLSRAPRLPGVDDTDQLIGTLAYVSPELLRGEPLTRASDVYALGVVCFELLEGRSPHPIDNLAQLAYHRLMQPAPKLTDALERGVPAPICELISAMLDPQVEQRPKDACEVLSILQPVLTRDLNDRLDALCAPFADRPATSARELERLFDGHELLHHQRSAPSQLLWRRIEATPSQLRDELERWIEQGIAVWHGKGLLVEQHAMLRLEPPGGVLELGSNEADEARQLAHFERAMALEPGQPGRAWELLLSAPTAQALELLLEEAALMDERGSIQDAYALFEDISRWVKSHKVLWPFKTKVLSGWAQLVLTQGEPAYIERVLHEVAQWPALEPLAKLMEAARLVCRSEASAGLSALNKIGAMSTPELELRRQQYRVQASWKLPLEGMTTMLDELEAWAKLRLDEEGQATVLGWRGILAARQGQWLEAAQAHERAASAKRRLTARISSLLNGASAYLDAGRFEQALALAQQAGQLSATIKHAHYEGRALLTTRAALYRSGQGVSPDLELVEAIGALELPEIEGLCCLYECAIAWRGGQDKLAHDLAQRSRRLWSRSGNLWGAHLAHAVALMLTPMPAPEMVSECAQKLLSCPLERITLQGVALLAPWLDASLINEARVRCEALRAHSHQERRAEILSLKEAWARLDAAPRA